MDYTPACLAALNTEVCPASLHACAQVLSSSCPLKVVASSLNSLSPVLLTDFTSPAELAECLKASAAVPHLAGPFLQLQSCGPVPHACCCQQELPFYCSWPLLQHV
jgi:hypothetical protein